MVTTQLASKCQQRMSWTTWIRTVAATAAALTLVLVGCSVFKSDSARLDEEVRRSELMASSAPKTKESTDRQRDRSSQPPVSKVRLDGSLSLGDVDQLAFTSVEFATTFGELLQSNKKALAKNLVVKFPDIAARVMLENHAQRLSLSDRTQLCQWYAQLWSRTPATFDSLSDSYRSGTVNSVLNQQREFMSLLENNRPTEALKLRIGKQLRDQPLLLAESLRLEGLALLMLEQHSQAAEKLESCVELLAANQPIEANRVRLLMGEAYRRAGRETAWNRSWTNAVESQSKLLANRDLMDPQFWKQAAFLRPASTKWPTDSLANIAGYLRNLGFEFNPAEQGEAMVWSVVGLNSLARHESQNAILSFKKAEAMVNDRFLVKELQLKQATAMIEGGQPGPASAILFRISSEPGLISDRAKAILATMKLQNGSLAQGMSLLQSAIKSSTNWPTEERLRAQADYGLAYLMRGKENQGVALLEQLQREFVRRGDIEQASQCLYNLATYFEKTDKPGEHRAVMARLKKLENQTF